MRIIWISKSMLTAVMLTVAAVCAIAQQEKRFTITGSLSKYRKGMLYLSTTDRANKKSALDSTMLVNGIFSFKSTMQDDIAEAMLMMRLPGTGDSLYGNANVSTRSFYLSPGNIKAAGQTLETLLFSGTKTMNEFMELENSQAAINKSLNEISARSGTIGAAPGYPGKKDSIAALRKRFGELAIERKKTEKNFVKTHPSSFVSVALLNNIAAMPESGAEQEIDDLIAGLAPVLKNRADMIAIGRRMQQLRNLGIGKPALDFSLPDSLGRNVTLASYRGKYVLVEFWASWCGPCRAEIPYLLKTYESFKNKNFDILGVSLDNNRSKWTAAIRQEKLQWTQVSDLKGPESELIAQYAITGIPLNFLLDPNGTIIGKDLRGNELANKLGELLKVN